MMSAKEMFEELSFKQTENDDSFIEYQMDDGDQHAEITFSLKDKNFRAIYGRYEFGMNFHYVTSDELKAIICQSKELGWIEPEQKQETNLEHYFEDLLKTEESYGFKDGRIRHCYSMDCDECFFNQGNCNAERFKWLASPYEKPICRLSRFEFDLLDIYKKCETQKCISNYGTLLEMYGKGHFKDVNLEATIGEILENCEIKGEENYD